MKEEIAATVFFIARLAKKRGKLDRVRREMFAVELTSVLFENYKSHWYPENPSKGQGFRWAALGLDAEKLNGLPKETRVHMWILFFPH